MNPLVLASSGEPLLEQTLLILFVTSLFVSKVDVADDLRLLVKFSSSLSFIAHAAHLRSTPSSIFGTAEVTELELDILITCSATLSASCSYMSPRWLTFNFG